MTLHPRQAAIPFFCDPALPPRFWAKVRLLDNGCWVWIAARSRDGYGIFGIGSRRTMLAHRLAYEILVGPISPGLESDHLCRNRACVNPVHLEPVAHAVNLRRSPLMTRKGEVNGSAKLRAKDIPEIRALRGRVSTRSLGAQFGVSGQVISDIQRGETWRHV